MKLHDWYKFNFENDDFSANIGDFYVRVLRNPSLKPDEHIFTQLMSADDMISIFGDYNLYGIGKEEDNNYTTIKVAIYKSNETTTTNTEDSKTEITLPMIYVYHGVTNNRITIRRENDNTFSIVTEFGEIIDYYIKAASIITVFNELMNGKYQ